MVAEDKNPKSPEDSKDIDLKADKLIQVLSQLSSTDLDKLEQMIKGEYKATEKDDRILKYLQAVSSLFNRDSSLLNDGFKNRLSRYEIYDEMEDTVAYISSALDILSDDATQPDEDGVVIHVKSDSPKVQNLVEQMIIDLEVQEKISKWARVVAKYGDFFLGVIGEEGEGVKRVDDTYYPGHIERKEIDGELVAFIDTTCNDPKQAIKAPWEFVHFRHKGDIYRKSEHGTSSFDGRNRYKLSGSYGQSVLQPAIRVYTQLRFVENILILSRLTNSIRRNIFLINTGDISADKAFETVKLYADLLKKDVTLDLDKGIYDSRKRTIKYDEDIFLPVSDTKNDIRVEQIGGDINISEQYDLEYLLNKLFASLKIPKAYLNYEQDLNARSTLIQLDIRYARSVSRLQQTLVGGLMRLAKIHLAYCGIDATNVDLEISLSSVSSIEAEIRRQEREQNLNNARTFLELMSSIKSAVEGQGDEGYGGYGGASGYEEEEPNKEPKPSKINMEYAAYYIMKEFMDVRDEDISKMLSFDITKYQQQVSKDDAVKPQKESARLKEYRIYVNSDIRAPLPSLQNKDSYERIRETIVSQVNMEV